MATPFDTYRGELQRRAAVDDAPEGAFVFELGHVDARDGRIAVGDSQEVKQDFLRAAEAAFLRPVVRVTPSRTLPVGRRWQLSITLNGTVFYSRELPQDTPQFEVSDVAIPLAAANAPPTTNEIAFKLELL